MDFERILRIAGVEWEEVVAEGIERLGDELNSEKIIFEVLQDGVRISIVTDDEHKKKAKGLWEEYIEDKVNNGDNE